MNVHVLQHVPFEGIGCMAPWLAARRAAVGYSHCRHELVPGEFVQREAAMRAVPDSAYAGINVLMSAVLDYVTRSQPIAVTRAS